MTKGIRSSSDEQGNVHWVAARGIETIAADTTITKGIVGIVPIADVEVYFGTENLVTFTIKAQTLFAVHQGFDVKLATTTKCLVF